MIEPLPYFREICYKFEYFINMLDMIWRKKEKRLMKLINLKKKNKSVDKAKESKLAKK